MKPTETNDHPEQDPAEGSREVIDRELARQDERDKAAPPKGVPEKDHRAG